MKNVGVGLTLGRREAIGVDGSKEEKSGVRGVLALESGKTKAEREGTGCARAKTGSLTFA